MPLSHFPHLTQSDLAQIPLDLHPGDRVFFAGDLGAGKTTMIRSLIQRYYDDPTMIVRSPTYTYYTRYTDTSGQGRGDIYHFDLYRVEDIEDFRLMGGEEIIDDPTTICLIEWAEILGDLVEPTHRISIEKCQDEDRRDVKIELRV